MSVEGDVSLVDLVTLPDGPAMAFALLRMRRPLESISHRQMPTWAEHCAYIESAPYAGWYGITRDYDGMFLGTIYLTRGDKPDHLGNEIGMHLFPEFRGMGYGRCAVRQLMRIWGKGTYHANIVPGNDASVAFFESLGFTPLQVTYSFKLSAAELKSWVDRNAD